MSRPLRWTRAPATPAAGVLVEELGLHPVVARLLTARAVVEPESATTFLHPRLADLRDPSGLADVAPAVERLTAAIDAGETIGVHGDYDVDGVTATAVMTSVLRSLGAEVLPYIPHRLREGYGLGQKGLEAMIAGGVRLIVTVDCGISAHVEVAAARAAGVDVIVVDHHALGSSLPAAVAVLNPHRPDCGFGFTDLAGVGVTFFLCVALRRAWRELGRPAAAALDLREVLDLVALGTVADQVALRDQNRILVASGLQVLRRAARPGIAALCEVAGLAPSALRASHLAFQLAPRINAVGRLGDALDAVHLMLTPDLAEATRQARVLDAANSERRVMERAIFQDALIQVEGRVGPVPDALILCGPDWHPGVVGIVASRMAERFARPTILIGADGRGSGRSVEGFNLHQALVQLARHMRTFGGHSQAVGLSIDRSEIADLSSGLAALARDAFGSGLPTPGLVLDGTLTLPELDFALVEALQELEPFGRGNPEPVFEFRDVVPTAVSRVGGDHVRFLIDNAPLQIKGIAFGMAERLAEGAFHGPVNLAAVPEIENWGSRRQLQLRVLDVAPPARPTL